MKRILICVVTGILCVLLMTACHEHQWKPATCETPGLCILCGQENGEVLPHQWVDATCQQAKTCTACNKTDGAPLPHQWINATCLQPKTCTVCQSTEGDPLGHEVADWETTVSATCQAEGLATGNCIRCQSSCEQTLNKLQHTPGQWEITTKATAAAAGERAQKCTVCEEVLATESYELSDQEKETLYKDSCQKYSYKKIARSPDAYKGKQAKFTGEVIQVQQQTIGNLIYYVLRVNVTKTGRYYSYYTDTVYVTYIATQDDPRILEEDIITMYGKLEGEKTYTTVLGSSVTIPAFTAKYIDIK